MYLLEGYLLNSNVERLLVNTTVHNAKASFPDYSPKHQVVRIDSCALLPGGHKIYHLNLFVLFYERE